jgi:hypothetical protein
MGCGSVVLEQGSAQGEGHRHSGDLRYRYGGIGSTSLVRGEQVRNDGQNRGEACRRRQANERPSGEKRGHRRSQRGEHASNNVQRCKQEDQSSPGVSVYEHTQGHRREDYGNRERWTLEQSHLIVGQSEIGSQGLLQRTQRRASIVCGKDASGQHAHLRYPRHARLGREHAQNARDRLKPTVLG